MSDTAPADPPQPPGRPWWAPLLGVGSIGLGGFQVLGGLAMAFAAMQLGGEAGAVFLGLCLAWSGPGILLAISGVGVVAGWRRARGLSLAAVAAGCLALGLVAANRAGIPGAVADLIDYGEKHQDSRSDLAALTKRLRGKGVDDPVAVLRNPELAGASAWTLAGECACPVVPWYLVVLLACALPSGRRIARE